MSQRARKYLIEAALTVGAVAGVLCVVVAIVSVSFGLSPLVFRSGSMSPAIGVGDVAISRSVPATDVSVGDIVSVTRADGMRITHRVVSIDSRVGNSTTMTLRGDANTINDTAPYTVTSVDRVVFSVPKLGYVLSWFTNPYAWALAALLTLGLLFAAFRPDRQCRPEAPRGRHSAPVEPTPTRSRRVALGLQAVAVVAVVAAAVTGYARTSGTLAALTDSATATGTVSAGRPEAPTAMTCTNVSGGFLVTNAQLSWPNPVSHRSYDYQFVFTPTGVTGGSGGTVGVAATTSDPATTVFTRSSLSGVLGLGLTGTYSVDLRSKVGNFLSSGKVTIALNLTLGSVTCGSTTGTASQTAQANARSAPAATTTTSQAPTTSSTPATTAPTSTPTTTSSTPAPTPTSTTPTAAAPQGTASPGGTYVASVSGGTVVIQDKATGAEQYRADLKAASIAWTDDTTLTVTATDGTVTTVSRVNGQWTASSTTATAPAAG